MFQCQKLWLYASLCVMIQSAGFIEPLGLHIKLLLEPLNHFIETFFSECAVRSREGKKTVLQYLILFFAT